MNNAYYFSDLNNQGNNFLESLEDFALKNYKQVFVLKKALSTNNSYDYKDACAILIQDCYILIADLNSIDTHKEEFRCFLEDFIEDLGFLSEKYKYREVLGRPREWSKSLVRTVEINANSSPEELREKYFINDSNDRRKVDLLTSLLTGSINSITRVQGTPPIELLDKVKRKIILYDGNQSNFIYKTKQDQKRIVIQGLAGTGKTELLLHKLREIYLNNPESKIVFTCYNKVLENDLLSRIPNFFNLMKVDEQIEWNKRLWVMRAWGLRNEMNSGVYSYICRNYEIPFENYGIGVSFEYVCKRALEKLETIDNFLPCFDYMFIDESQDFDENFFKLCEKVSSRQIFIAGDVFQNIFDTKINSIKPDYIINKCYRTEPKTLMMAHAIGMGLYEKPVLRWLEDDEWKICGYSISRNDSNFKIERLPVRRFEDVPQECEPIIIRSEGKEDMIIAIKNAIKELKDNNKSMQPDDLAIIFTQRNMKKNCQLADDVEYMLFEEFGWTVTKGYETKYKTNNTVFISNINNIKGLEFPFVICVEEECITSDLRKRNAIYMALTRSFLTSYFIVNSAIDNKEFIETYSKANDSILKNNAILIIEPTKQEKEFSKENILKFQTELDKNEIYDRLQREYHLDTKTMDFFISIGSKSKLGGDELYNYLEVMAKNVSNIMQ